jgi:hypothetical protein
LSGKKNLLDEGRSSSMSEEKRREEGACRQRETSPYSEGRTEAEAEEAHSEANAVSEHRPTKLET